MKKIILTLFFLSLFYRCYCQLQASGNNVNTIVRHEERKTTRKCGLWRWGRCTQYVSEIKINFKCKEGWAQESSASKGCDYAICAGKTNLSGACNIRYYDDYQKTRKETFYNSGGKCSSPDICSGCNNGFYSDGPYCRICGRIDHCNFRKCTTSNNQHCEICEGDIKPNKYWRAYTNHLDNTKCQKACSWRTDSTRCYPGTCTNELFSGCVCADNFSGTHCESIDVKPVIGLNHCKFADDGGYNILENAPNWKTTGHPTIWTNIVQYTKVSINMSAQYRPVKFPPLKDKTLTHFVKGIAVGIIQESATISYYKGSALYSSQTTKPCKGLNKDHPKSHEYCNHEFNIVSWSQSLSHNDRVVAEFSSTNGGYVIVADRDAKFDDSQTNKYYYNGKTLSRMFEYHWDLENPYHCSQSLGTSCTPFLDIVDDITENPNLSFTWGGWSDDLSGLDHYEYDLFYLGMDNVVLIDGAGAGGRFLELLSKKNISVTESSVSIALEDPGMYSLHLVAYDKAGNYKSGRTLFLFDNLSMVDIQGNKPTYCSTASKDTSYTWVTKDISRVKIDWKGRFINIRHNAGKWLNPVQTYAKGEGVVTYEDLYGSRTHVGIKNVGAIVDFQVSYQVDSSDSITTSVKDSRPFTSVSNINNQYDILTLDWADGDQLTATVKAIDILDKANQETIVVYRDATPPIIENIWLTRSDRLNVSVHNLEDFTKMTIEWEAYDVHSGLDSVYWRLYDSKTGVRHGHEDIIAQGHSSNLTHCENKYSDYARGANCYCTPFQGCFHRHFQIKPEIKQHGGLIVNKDKGTHEYDYFIEISVTSIAKLTTVLTKKVDIHNMFC